MGEKSLEGAFGVWPSEKMQQRLSEQDILDSNDRGVRSTPERGILMDSGSEREFEV